MPSSENTLVSALGELAALGTDRDREQLAALLDRLDAARLRVLVVGEAKRGKSTLVNALLRRDLLPSGVTPLTAVTTTVRYGDDERAEVRFLDGHDEKHPLAVLPDLVTERGNPGNRRRIAGVTVYIAAPVLADGVELVDTPGTGSVFEWDTQAAHEALRSMDAALFVLTADPPVSASERDLLEQVAQLSVRTFVVLNKADHLEEPGLAEALEFTQRVLGEAGHPGPVYPMSARAALGGADAGFAAFEADFTAYLSARGKSDLQASAIAQARRIAGSLLDEVAVTRRVAGMRAGDAADRVRRFGERLAEVTVHGRDAVTVVNAESGRLLFALNDAAEEDRPRLAREVARQLDELLGGSLREAPAGEIERRGRERLGAFAVAAAEAWRQRRREAIEQGLAAVDARLAGQLGAELGVLRESAAELLGLDLAVPEPEGRWPRAGGSSTSPGRISARPSCWPAPSGGGCPGSSAGGRPGITCAARSPTWWACRSAGPGGTCSTGWPRRRARWAGWSSSAIPTGPAGSGPRWRPRPSCATPPPPRRRPGNGHWPDAKRRCVASRTCWTRPWCRGRPFPSHPIAPAASWCSRVTVTGTATSRKQTARLTAL